MKTINSIFTVLFFLTVFNDNVQAGDTAKSYKKSAQDILKAWDSAKKLNDLESAKKDLVDLDATSDSVMQAFVSDKSKKGEKRSQVFKVLQSHLPEGQRQKEIIQAFKTDKDTDFKVDLAQQLGSFTDTGTLRVLQETIDNPSENGFVQVSAAHSLARRGDAGGKKRALQSILNAESWADFGIQALVVLKANDVFPILEEKMMNSQDSNQKGYCRLAKLRIQVGMAAPKEHFKLLSAALNEDGFPKAADWAAKRLAKMGGEDVSKLFVSVVKAGKWPNQEFAHDGLLFGIQYGHWSQEDVTKWLAK